MCWWEGDGGSRPVTGSAWYRPGWKHEGSGSDSHVVE